MQAVNLELASKSYVFEKIYSYFMTYLLALGHNLEFPGNLYLWKSNEFKQLSIEWKVTIGDLSQQK